MAVDPELQRLVQQFGKGSPEVIAAANRILAGRAAATGTKPLVVEKMTPLLKIASPAIALVTAGLGIPALGAIAGLPAPPTPTPKPNGGQTVPDFRDVLLSAGTAVLGSFAAQLPVPRPPTLPAPRPTPLPRPGAPAPPRAPSGGRRPIPIPLPIPGVPSIGEMFGGGAPRRRRMNFLNPKALKRSAARIKGFYKISRGIEAMLRRSLPRPRAIAAHGHKVVSFRKRA